MSWCASSLTGLVLCVVFLAIAFLPPLALVLMVAGRNQGAVRERLHYFSDFIGFSVFRFEPGNLLSFDGALHLALLTAGHVKDGNNTSCFAPANVLGDHTPALASFAVVVGSPIVISPAHRVCYNFFIRPLRVTPEPVSAAPAQVERRPAGVCSLTLDAILRADRAIGRDHAQAGAASCRPGNGRWPSLCVAVALSPDRKSVV